MSFSLGFDDVLPNSSSNSYQGSPFHTNADGGDYGGGGFGGSGPIGLGEEAMSTAFTRGASVTASASQDLKDMLDSNKDGLKIEAMKRLVTMIARGKNESAARSLFPCVVKCVVTKNPELKKLVYAYLVRFAESEPDLALLSVSSFQRSLKDPNPLIRGSALRVLSSIRVPVIAPLILAAIKESSSDMSPYVRKIAALSIPKLVSLEADMKEEAISLIERLLKDRTSHVLGSVVAAFQQICPERLDLIHPHYRKFVSLLPDFDEWGQVTLIHLLTVYARTQFTDPFKLAVEIKTRKSGGKKSSDNEDSDDESEEEVDENGSSCINMDNDLRMLLKNCRPLLQSRNSAVVFSVLQLHLAIFLPENGSSNTKSIADTEKCSIEDGDVENSDPNTENVHKPERRKSDARAMRELRNQLIPQWMAPCVKPLIRLIASSSSHCEIQQLVLTSIVSLTSQPELAKTFENFLRSFFVKSRDNLSVKMLKLQILTNLSNSANIGLILREFQAYVNSHSTSSDESDSGSNEGSKFVSAVITAIGDVATRIREVAEICLKGLISLLSNKTNEAIIAQSVIVIRTQIMNREREASRDEDFAQASTESTVSRDSIGTVNEVTTLIIKQLVNSRLMNPDNQNNSDNGNYQSLSAGNKKKKSSNAWSRARATILWILSEFCAKNLTAYQSSPDVLRKFSKNFANESNLVKLQIINLSAKMSVASHPDFSVPFLLEGQEKNSLFDRDRFLLLNEYIFNLAKYDLNYDIRDRARFLKSLFKSYESNLNRDAVQAILFVKHQKSKADRVQTAQTKRGQSQFRVGSLSHFLDQKAPNYQELPPFPKVQPDPSVRDIKETEVVSVHSSNTATSFSSAAANSSRNSPNIHGVPDKPNRGFNIDPGTSIGVVGAGGKKVDSDLDKFYSSDDDSSDEDDDSSDDSSDESSDEDEEDGTTLSGEGESSSEDSDDGSEEDGSDGDKDAGGKDNVKQ